MISREISGSVCVMWDFDHLSSLNYQRFRELSASILFYQIILCRVSDFVSNRFSETMLGIHIRAANESKASSSFLVNIYSKTVEGLLKTNQFEGIFLSTDHLPTQEWFLRVFLVL